MNRFATFFRCSARLLSPVVALLLWLLPTTGFSDSSRNNKIKEGFTYHFILFGDWPDQAFVASPEYFTVGLVCDTDSCNFLNDVEGQLVDKRTLVVHHLSSSPTLEELLECQIIFIRDDRIEVAQNILSMTAHAPILTVSDMEGFVKHGGMIEFANRRNRIKFNIHRGRTSQAGIKFSAQMLKMAGKIWEDES